LEDVLLGSNVTQLEVELQQGEDVAWGDHIEDYFEKSDPVLFIWKRFGSLLKNIKLDQKHPVVFEQNANR
jgi:hypothetical protein